jgi:hypothetical protein
LASSIGWEGKQPTHTATPGDLPDYSELDTAKGNEREAVAKFVGPVGRRGRPENPLPYRTARHLHLTRRTFSVDDGKGVEPMTPDELRKKLQRAVAWKRQAGEEIGRASVALLRVKPSKNPAALRKAANRMTAAMDALRALPEDRD